MNFKVDENLLTELFYRIYALPALQIHEDEGFELTDEAECIEREQCKTTGAELLVMVRHLELPHFFFLSRFLSLSLDDLSFYILPFLLGCKGEVPLSIMEFEFVKGLLYLLSTPSPTSLSAERSTGSSEIQGRMLASTCENSSTRSNTNDGDYGGCGAHFNRMRIQFQPLWNALQKRIETCRREICQRKEKTQAFYNFLYMFVLHRNNSPEPVRRQLAVELWEMFFTPHATSYFEKSDMMQSFPPSKCEETIKNEEEKVEIEGEKEEAKAPLMLHLAEFKRLPDWISFVTDPAFLNPPHDDEEEDEEYQEHCISLDMWQQLWYFSKLTCFDKYDFCSPWPNAMDDFVKYVHRMGTSLASSHVALDTH